MNNFQVKSKTSERPWNVSRTNKKKSLNKYIALEPFEVSCRIEKKI